jgi:hypothetical protein
MERLVPKETQNQVTRVGYIIQITFNDFTALDHPSYLRGSKRTLGHSPDGVRGKNQLSTFHCDILDFQFLSRLGMGAAARVSP